MDLSIVIVSYNTREFLRACLTSVRESLARSPGLHAETFVVDNASGDGSPAMVAAEFPEVKLIVNAENRGFAAANNLAIRQAGGRHVLLLNADTVVRGDALAQLVALLDRNPRVGAAGPRLLNPDGTRQQSVFRFPTLWMSLFDFFPLNHRLVNSRLNGRYPERWHEHVFPVDHPLGACLIVRRAAIDQVGLLDEGFFMYCEEVDWCLRIRQAGWEILYTPAAEVVHYGGQSTAQFRHRMFVELQRSRLRFFRKHYGRPFVWAHRLIVALGLAREALVAWWAVRSGRLAGCEFRERLATYWQIVRL